MRRSTPGGQVVAASPAGHPGRAGMLATLAGTLYIRFARAEDQADLDASIDAWQQAVAATPADHPHRAAYLSGLGIALRTRFARAEDQADLDAAIDAWRQAVAATPAGDPGRAGYLSGLGAVLQLRGERIGDRADLDAAIDALRQAVAASPPDDPDRAMYLTDLATALRTRFERAGALADLDAAIDALRQAVAATPADDPRRAGYLSDLGTALRMRFEQAGALADLEAAIDVGRQAVAATPVDDPYRAKYLASLGTSLQTRSKRTDDRADMDSAIDLLRQAVAATPVGHPQRAGRLSNLSTALATRSKEAGDRADLDSAIDLLRQAVAASPADHPDRAGPLSNLCAALYTRFTRAGALADLDAAIDAAQQAVAASPADHPGRIMRLSNLSAALQIRGERIGDRADLDAALNAGQQAAAIEVASPLMRVEAARRWGDAAAVCGRWQEAVAGFTLAVSLLGRVAPRSLARRDQESLLGGLGGLAPDAAACCVHAGLTDRAVELFEQGRGVLLGQALDTRTDLTALAEQFPDLASRFTAMRDDLDRPGDRDERPEPLPAGMNGVAANEYAGVARLEVERRRETADAFERMIADIQAMPGFDTFLRPLPVRDLAAAAAKGPVVVINVSRFGSHALILTGSGVLDPVPLEDLTPDSVFEHTVEFETALEDMTAAAEGRLVAVLGWLWDAVAGPVLGRLGITGPPLDGQPWPRLWWCVSGLLSFLPVHAAGHHDTRAGAALPTVIDRVISSYTPTLRGLIHARRPARPGADGGDRPGAGDQVVAVAMPHTPGARDLPGAVAEAAWLQRRFPGQVTVLTGAQATHEAVLAALPSGRWAHFACHGASDLANPSASCLLLTDYRQRPLTVTDVARLRLDGAGLAFLSACSTAQPGNQLADEAIHLASAFQLAGYRHVIATLWPIRDQHAVDFTADIYTTLTPASEGDAVGAVHAAARRMRRRWGWDTPSVWASHIHVGA